MGGCQGAAEGLGPVEDLGDPAGSLPLVHSMPDQWRDYAYTARLLWNTYEVGRIHDTTLRLAGILERDLGALEAAEEDFPHMKQSTRGGG